MRTHEHRAPARLFAATAGLFLTALGGMSLIFGSTQFDAVSTADASASFLIWPVSGWNGVFWLVLGALGLLAMARLPSARIYALLISVVFATVALWGAVDGDDVAGLLVAGLVNDVTHALLAFAGLMAGLADAGARVPEDADHPLEGREPIGRW